MAASIPVFDMSEDIFIEGDPPLTSLVENSSLILLGLIIIAIGV